MILLPTYVLGTTVFAGLLEVVPVSYKSLSAPCIIKYVSGVNMICDLYHKLNVAVCLNSILGMKK